MKTDDRPREVIGVLPMGAVERSPQGPPGAGYAGGDTQGRTEDAVAARDAWPHYGGQIPGLKRNGIPFLNDISTDPAAGNADELAHNVHKYCEIPALRAGSMAADGPAETCVGLVVLDRQGRIASVNPAFTQLCGYLPSDVLGESLQMLSYGGAHAEFCRVMWKSIELGGYWSGEVWIRRKDGTGTLTWLSMYSMHDGAGPACSYQVTLAEVGSAMLTHEPSGYPQHLPPFMALPSRARFMDQLGTFIQRSQCASTSTALLLLDIDHFQEANHALGYEACDRVLMAVAQRLCTVVQDKGLVARTGDDEFSILIGDACDSHAVQVAAQAMLDALSESFVLREGSAYVTTSIGIALFPGDANGADDLLRAAGKAMRAAKASGRNCYNYFTPELELQTPNRLWLAHDLRSALSQKQFWLAYQPIVSLKTGKVHKAEALIRWQHPARGLISPADFIPVAESTGMIVEIGEWVFRTAADQVAQLRRQHSADFQVSVNKSPAQFHRQTELSESWSDYLRRRGLSCRSIVVEITEGLLLEDSQRVDDHLRLLREAGVQLSLDDFGTGYSSLAYLQKHDIDYVKIDQSFVRNLVADSKEMTLCEAIITIAHKLNMEVVAEGIETAEQLQLLRDAGCDYGQGYFMARPMSASALDAFLAPSGNGGNSALKG